MYRTVVMPAEWPGNFYTPELSTDWSGPSLGLVGVIRGIEGQDDTPTWSALATIDPKTGAATVLRNLTLEEASFKWVKTGCSTFDSDAQVFYLIAGVGASEAETVLGYGKDGTPAISIPFDAKFDAISLEWSSSLKTLVALAYLRNAEQSTMSWLVHDAAAPGTWKPAFTWPVGTVFLSGMGETDIEDGGRIVAAALTVAAAGKVKERNIISFVDIVDGVEYQRSNVTEKMSVADMEFCDAVPPAL